MGTDEEALREKLRKEIEEEILSKLQGSQLRVSKKDSLAKEVDQHRCPICMEHMSPPQAPPMMLVPCGHTFCDRCLKKHKKQAVKLTCPICRASTQNIVPNHSLRAIIEAYTETSFSRTPSSLSQSVEERIAAHVEESKRDQVREYITMYSMSEARDLVLESEQQGVEEELSKVEKKLEVDRKVASYLAEEGRQLKEQIQKLGEELALVHKQLGERKEGIRQSTEAQRELQDRIEGLKNSRSAIARESLKAKTILTHLAPSLDLSNL